MDAQVEPPLPRVTLVVPVRNEGARLDDCLGTLSSQTYPAHLLEILVVDGASGDDTAARASAWAQRDGRIRVMQNPDRAMPAGLNLGIRHSSGAVVGVISGHSGVGPDYVERCIAALRQTNAWCVGGRIERVAETPMQHAIAVATSSPLGVGDARHNYATTAEWVDTVFPGMWPREVFDRIGLFDVAMTANEDNELSHRIRGAGGRIWYDPSIVIRYHPRATLSGLFSQYRRYGLGKVLVFRKHHGAVSWRHAVPGLWVTWLVAGLALGAAWPPLLPIWAAGIGLYLLVIAVGSFRLARGGVSALRVGAALATLHLAYGFGLWQGLLMAPVRK